MPSGLFDKEWHTQKKSVGKTYCYSEELDFYAKRQQRKQTFLFNGTMHCILISYKFSILYSTTTAAMCSINVVCAYIILHAATREQHHHCIKSLENEKSPLFDRARNVLLTTYPRRRQFCGLVLFCSHT